MSACTFMLIAATGVVVNEATSVAPSSAAIVGANTTASIAVTLSAATYFLTQSTVGWPDFAFVPTILCDSVAYYGTEDANIPSSPLQHGVSLEEMMN